MAALLLMTCGIVGCGINPPINSAATDPAVLEACPRRVESPGALPARVPVQLSDGSWAVPVDQADSRENMLTKGALAFRGAWIGCKSVVQFVEDRDAKLAK